MPDAAGQTELLVGHYDQYGGGGLSTLTRSVEGEWLLSTADQIAHNASYAVYSRRHDIYFVVDEREQGSVGAYRRCGQIWTRLQEVSSGGSAPCFLGLNGNETALAVANYESGSVAWFEIDGNGRLSTRVGYFQNKGGRPATERQTKPHAHCARFHKDRLYSADLGTDEVHVHPIDGSIRTQVALRLSDGQGPRHIIFHRALPTAYLVTELGNCLFSLAVGGDGLLEELDQVSTLPKTFTGSSTAAHIALNRAGTRLYVSNRGDDSIACFRLDEHGRPRSPTWTHSGAEGPRHFCLLEPEQCIVVAHQAGGRVSVLQLGTDGLPGKAVWSIALSEAAFVDRLHPEQVTSPLLR